MSDGRGLTDRPIIFSAPMVRALLDGRKTQTRRILTPQPPAFTPEVIDISTPVFDEDEGGWGQWRTDWASPTMSVPMGEPNDEVWRPLRGLRWAVGDRLWVREKVRAEDDDETWDRLVRYLADDATVKVADQGDNNSDAFGKWWSLNGYRSDDPDLTGGKPVPSIHMPRWASRLTLVVTEVRVERLNDLSEADAEAEGVEPIVDHGVGNTHLHSIAYQQLWDHLHGQGAWLSNPWVAAITFEVHRANIDALDAERAAA